MRRLLRLAFLAAVGVLALGLVLVAASALAASGLYLAAEPWIGTGLDLVTIGLGLSALLGLLVVAGASHLGRLRLLAIPPALVLGFWWSYLLMLVASGIQETFRGPRAYDIPTEIYSSPEQHALLLGLPTIAVIVLALMSTRRAQPPLAPSPTARPSMAEGAAPGGPA